MRSRRLWIGLGLAAVVTLVGARAVAFLNARPTQPTAHATETVRAVRGGGELVVLRTTLVDADRHKELPIRIVFAEGTAAPADSPDALDEEAGGSDAGEQAPEPLPLIVFSHGMYGSGENLDPLAHHWASHGYVVILPTHADSLSLRTAGMSRLEKMQLAREMQSGRLRDMNTQFQAHWADRPRDVSLILDSLDAIGALDGRLSGRIDRERIGVGGHSFGAMTTMLIGGAEPIKVPRALEQDFERDGSLADERVKCVLMISPQGMNQRFGPESWDDFDLTALTISGDRDRGSGGQPAEWRRHAFDLGHAGSHALVWIEGAEHHFGGMNGNTRRGQASVPEHVKAVQDATLAFWESSLRGDEQDAGALAAALKKALVGQRVRVEHREAEAVDADLED